MNKYNDDGCFAMRICKDGVWRYEIVDDYFPCL